MSNNILGGNLHICGASVLLNQGDDMFTIKVVSSSTGNSIKGKRVAVSFTGWSRGITDSKYTDANGEVHFDSDPGEGEVFLDGKSVFRGKIAGRVIVYE